MEKNIYRLLNDVKTDLTEFDETELSREEKERHKQKILQEVRNMKKDTGKNNRKQKSWKIAAGAAAAGAIVIGTAGAAGPAAATNLFSHAFGQLIENTQGEKYEKEDTEMFTALGRKSVQAQDEVNSRKDKEEYTTTVTDHGVTITVSDIYCDGYILYYTSTLQTDQKDLQKADGISSFTQDGTYYDELEIEGIDTSGYSSRPFQKTKDGTFISVNQVNLMDSIGNSDSESLFGADSNGTAVVNWTLKNLTGSVYDQWEENGEYKTTGKAEGEWHLRFPVTIDKSSNQTFAINQEQNGFFVKNAVQTKAGLVVELEIPDLNKKPYKNTDMGIIDAQGNWLQWLGQQTIRHEDGSATCRIMVLYDGQKDLTFQVTSKEETPKVLVDIDFKIS